MKDEIKVGDEVYLDGGIKAVVTRVISETEEFNVFFCNGDTGYYPRRFIAKTGRHFNEIKKVLRKMRDEE
jgi:preprotein translocase subunit YajC